MLNKFKVALYTVTATLCMASFSFAAYDYSDIVDGVTAEVNAALPLIATLVGMLIGIPLAVKMLRRLAR